MDDVTFEINSLKFSPADDEPPYVVVECVVGTLAFTVTVRGEEERVAHGARLRPKIPTSEVPTLAEVPAVARRRAVEVLTAMAGGPRG